MSESLTKTSNSNIVKVDTLVDVNFDKKLEDTTPIVINGKPLDKTTIKPIEMSEEISPASPMSSPKTSPRPSPKVPRIEIPKSPHVTPRPSPRTSPVRVNKSPTKEPRVVIMKRVDDDPDFSKMGPVEMARNRVILQQKYRQLQSNFPNMCIPDINPTDSLEVQHQIYKEYFRQGTKMNSGNIVKMFIQIIYCLMALFLNKVLDLQASNFFEYARKSIKKYDSMIIELGDMSLMNEMLSWPVWIRLGLMILADTVIFAVAGLFGGTIIAGGIADKTSEAIGGKFNFDDIFDIMGNFFGGIKKPEPVNDEPYTE